MDLQIRFKYDAPWPSAPTIPNYFDERQCNVTRQHFSSLLPPLCFTFHNDYDNFSLELQRTRTEQRCEGSLILSPPPPQVAEAVYSVYLEMFLCVAMMNMFP